MKKNKQEKDRVHQESSKFLYVGVGASAGGLDALKKFLSNIPKDNGMAYIIVQHMDPNQKSGLVNILSRSTYMEVNQIEDGTKVMPEHVYVIPPNKDLGILDGNLQLMEPTEPHGLRLPIDYFFTSLGQDQRDKSVGIILSGFGSDGSNGLKVIKANGGICIAQDPSTAGSESMPNSAINTGLVDMVLTPEEMSEKLISYNNSSTKILKEILSPEDGTIQALRKIFILIRNRTGQDFSQYKKNTINRRIGRRMNIHQIDDITQYLRYLQQTPNEIDLLYNEFLINVTNFFRDPDAFESLKNGALMKLIEEKNDGEVLRVWVPGCSSGEEIYSIAIIIKELLDKTHKHLEVQIFGTDLDENAIKKARSGTYSNIAEEITPERLNNFFYKKDGLYTIKKEIRDMVIFSIHNVITDPPFTQLDLISCRNLLIYLEVKAQEKVLSNFRYALKKDGILFIGPSENIGEFFDSFSVVENKWKIYKSVKSNTMRFNHIPIRKTNYLQPLAYRDTKFDLNNPNQQNNDMNIVNIAEENLIDLYAPPSAVINKGGDILYIHGRLGEYLEPSEGKAHMNILDMARNGLKSVLSTVIQNAISNNRKVISEDVNVENEYKNQFIKLTVTPLKDSENIRGLLIVSFEESSQENKIKLNFDNKSNNQIKALANELKITKERLNKTIEDLTTSNEELKSANEELQSMNEESQSTNEELETSKEELQSINEELTTVNTELQIKIDELTHINDDMTNLFNSTDIAIIFVDNKLNIRRFTNESTKLIKLINSDIGRPLSDISTNIRYSDLVYDIKDVISKVILKEKEVKTTDNKWYKVRITPYKTSNNIIDGATVTFVDISYLKNIQEKIQSARDYAENIINTIREPLLVLDSDLKVISANKSFYEKFKLKKTDAEGVKLYNLGDNEWDIPSLRNLLEDILPKNNDMKDYELENDFSKIGHKKFLLNARRIYRGDIGTQLILMAMEEYKI